MSVRRSLDALLLLDTQDAGCDLTWRLIDVYVEMVVAGQQPDTVFPGLTAHLAACDPCAEDYRGLLAAVRAENELDPGR